MSTEIKAHSTSSGTVIGPEAEVVGLGGIFDHLMNEHGELTRLMRQVLAAAPDERTNIYPVLRTDLLAHERTERAVLYATLRQFPATQAHAEAHEQQVGEFENLFRRLDSLNIRSEEWHRSLATGAEIWRCHVRREEDEYFPLAHGSVGERQSHDLKVAYLGTKPGIVNTIEADAPAR